MIPAALSFGIIAAAVLIGVPVAFSFGAGVLVFAFLADQNISYLVPSAFWDLNSYAIISVPLFIMAGMVMARSGISDSLIRIVNVVVGPLRGGLGAVTVIACLLFGAISGSAAAAIASIGSVMIPRMVRDGYDRGYATSLVACSSVLALAIPPSIPMIIFAMTANISIAAAFLSTTVPGILLAIAYCTYNYFAARRMGIKPLSPDHFPEGRRVELGRSLRHGGLALLLPVIMLGSIYSGTLTTTEAAAISLFYSILIGLLYYRGIGVRGLGSTLVEAIVQTGSFIIVVFFLLNLSRVLVLEGIPRDLSEAILSLSDNRILILLLVNIVLLLIGMVMDDASGGILAAIILMPIVVKAGVDPIHFAAIVATNLSLGTVAPPTAPMLYIAASVGGISTSRVTRPVLIASSICHLPIVFLVTYVPDLALFLPRVLLGYGG